MTIKEITNQFELLAPPPLQEAYDNSGLLTGNALWECTGAVFCLDATEEVVLEAVEKKYNLVIAHHPIIFSGLKKINGKNYVEKAVIAAIKNDIAIYVIHTNLDNVLHGVNAKIADKLGLINRRVLLPKSNLLKKFFVFVPAAQAELVRNAIFAAGGGHIGNYSECSFNTNGEGTFKAGEGSSPFVGKARQLHTELEVKIEVIFPGWLQHTIVSAVKAVHPYEEMAYDVVPLENAWQNAGSGLVGDLETELTETGLLELLKQLFNLTVIRHTALLGKKVKKIAVCGGAGSFLTGEALASGADFYITADVKYHEFFDANNRLVIADIGHYESEQFTIDLLYEFLQQKFPTFASLKTGVNTNPVRYFK